MNFTEISQNNSTLISNVANLKKNNDKQKKDKKKIQKVKNNPC